MKPIPRGWSRDWPTTPVEARVKTAALVLLAAITAGCGPTDVPASWPDGSGLRLTCSMATLSFRIGQELPPPELTITNTIDRHVDLIGPTLTVISCSLLQPDSTLVELRLAMPTGRDPASMPKTRLQPGTSIDFTPTGIWYYGDGVGYEPYIFELQGTYEIYCQYGGVRSNTLMLEVHGQPPQVTDHPETG